MKNYFKLFLNRIKNSTRVLKTEHSECAKFVSYLIEMTIRDRCKAVWFHPCNEVSNNTQWGFGHLLTMLGKIKGAPDYVFVWEGGGAFIEFKAPSQKLSDSQGLFQEWCEDKKAIHVVATSSAEAIQFLTELGVLKDKDE